MSDTEKNTRQGSQLQHTLEQGYQLDLMAIFKESFQLTLKNFVPMLFAAIGVLCIMAALLLGLNQFGLSEQPQVSSMIIAAATLLVFPPLLAGLNMMGIQHAAGLKTRSTQIFDYFSFVLPLALSSLLMSLLGNVLGAVLVSIGLPAIVILIPMLYINMVFCFVAPLIVEKKLPIFKALLISFKVVNKGLFQFVTLYSVILVLFFVGSLPAGLGLLFVVPFYFNLLGLVYLQLCGYADSQTEDKPLVQDNNHFDA